MAQSSDSSSLLDISGLRSLEKPRLGLVFTEWNEAIVKELMAGCKRICGEIGAEIVEEVQVPGAFELPFGAKLIWQYYKGRPNAPEALITFGAVIRGGTPHFDYVCQAATIGITNLNIALPVPVIFGVLTLDNEEQAWERLGGPHGHKGEEAAIAALKMIQQARRMKEEAMKNKKGIGFGRFEAED